jgi:hypothetical protein
LKVSKDTGVPAYLLKNIFERESQFWPGIYQNYKEAGLGQMTENGADVLLLWNPSFFDNFCPLVLSSDTCQKGFSKLTDDQRQMLRGALVVKVNADCPTCANGIDLSQANFSVGVFAQTLLANCDQTARVVYNTTGSSPGLVANYEDLWRFTLANYNAGSGCLSAAIDETWRRREPLDWEHVSNHLGPICQGAIEYVETVTQLDQIQPTATPWAHEPVTPPDPLNETPMPDPENFEG